MAAAFFLAALLYFVWNIDDALIWLAVVVALSALRALSLPRTGRMAVMARRPARARMLILAGLVASGLLWATPVMLVPAQDFAAYLAIGFFAAGMTAGAAAGLGAVPYAYSAFVLPLLSSLVTRLVIEQTDIGYAMAASVAAFAIGMYGIVRSGRREATNTLEQWLINRRLNRRLLASRANEIAALERAAANSVARREAEDSEAAKSRFLATVSHELRTPLNAVIGFSDMIADEFYGPVGNAKYNEYAHEIRGSGERLLRLIDDMLAVSTAQRGPEDAPAMEPLGMDELCQSVAREFAIGGLDAHDRISVAVSPPGATAYADPRLLRRIVQNLLENAIKFSSPESPIAIDVTQTTNGGVKLCVQDRGIGIPEDQLNAVTEPFTQVDDTDMRLHSGAGLGLAIVKRYVDAHGGEMRLASPGQNGLLVEIVLPPARENPVAAKA